MAASPFRPATDLLVQYARYHRDPRNIARHFNVERHAGPTRRRPAGAPVA